MAIQPRFSYDRQVAFHDSINSDLIKLTTSDYEDLTLIYRFGLFELDTTTAEIRRQGRRLPLQEQPYLVLKVLLSQPRATVSREMLRQTLWPAGHHVDSDAGINAAVRRLRDVLGDSASNPRFVVTVPKQGYRFIAPVETVQPQGSPLAESTTISQQIIADTTPGPPAPIGDSQPERLFQAHPLLLGLSFIVILIAALLYGSYDRLGSSPPSSPSDLASPTTRADSDMFRLAVLPFATHGTDPDRAFLGDALSDELIVRLGRMEPERLQVIARTSVQGFQGPQWDVEAIAQHLGIDFVLEGSIRQEGDRLRIHVALVDAGSQTQSWSQSFDRSIGGLMPLEKEIANRVAQSLALELDMSKSRPPARGRYHELYLEGRYFLERLTEKDLRLALEAFAAAGAEDPDVPSAYAGAAEAWVAMGIFDFSDPRDAFPKARSLAEQALDRDPGSASAIMVLAVVKHIYDWDFAAAGPLFERALELDPGDPFLRLFAAAFESHMGNQDRALQLAYRALELDPLSPTVNAELCHRLFVARREQEAIERCQWAIELDPAYLSGWDVLKWIHIHRGADAQATEAFLRVVELETIHKESLPSLRRVAEREGIRGLIQLSLHDPAARLAESGQSPYNLALDYAALGRIDEAMDRLHEAYQAHETDMVTLAVDPRLDNLQGHGPFQDLLLRMGLTIESRTSAIPTD